MQQLTIEHKSNNLKQVVSENTKTKDRREGKGRILAISRRVFRLVDSDTFCVESESTENVYYFVRYEPSFHWCSCLDNSTRHVKCKHIFAIEYAIVKGTLKDIEHLPKEAKRYPTIVTKSYRDDSYDF
jgi:hypothetical protein